MTDLYQEAARIILRANLKEASLKTLVYSSSYRNLRQLFALVSESIKYQSILKDVLTQCGSSFLKEEMIDNNSDLAIVLLYELLIGNGFGRAGFVRKVMRKYKAEIKSACDAVLKENNASSLKGILNTTTAEPLVIPRYARVNLIKSSVDNATEKLYEEGWECVGKLSIDKFKEDVTSLGQFQFGLDPLLDDVFVFPVETDLHDHALVADGILALQDRASCVPAHVLNPPAGCVVLDSCAAPGNKTSHLASLMRDGGRIIGLDRDSKRMTTMKLLLQRAGTVSVETIVQDFLTLSPQSEDVSEIEMILVDPSCSGSGRPGSDRDINPHRLQTLKRFQISLLKHALRFPKARQVVYSTCSIHQEENEEVVEEVMDHVNKYFNFSPVLPHWPDSRGLKQFKNHENFLRLSPEKDMTTGFFVACFERKALSGQSCEKDCNNEKEITKDESQEQFSSNKHDVNVTMEDKDKEDSEPAADDEHSSRKKKKKKKKKMDDEDEDTDEKVLHRRDVQSLEGKEADENLSLDMIEDSQEKKKSKKKHKKGIEKIVTESVEELCSDETQDVCEKKKKSKKRKKEIESNDSSENPVSESDNVEKKKRKHKEVNGVSSAIDIDVNDSENCSKLKRKKKSKDANEEIIVEDESSDHKKAKKRKKTHMEEREIDDEEEECKQTNKKLKKKKKKEKLQDD